MKVFAALTAAVIGTLFVAGCSSTTDISGQESTRTVDHSYGTTEVPVHPQRIVATDEYAAMSLLAVGVVPAVVFTGFGSPIGDRLSAQAGSEVIEVPPTGAPPTEDVLAQNPDLVVSSDYGDDTLYRAISETVPTVPMPYATPWRESLAFTAGVFDRDDDAARLESVLDSDIDALRSDVAAHPVSLSVLMNSSDILAVAAPTAPSSILAAEVGISAPPMQADPSTGGTGGPWTALSPEVLPSQNADIVAVFDEGVYSAENVRRTPGFAEATGDRAVEVNGDMWFAGHPFAVYWLVRDLRALIDGNVGDVGSEATAQSRYDDFVAASR
ncbi:ABC transporter substrate-binding protein [Rhodococcus sp. RS1C4]|uniref:ABC transporter substrate-binding protein n=1 Tax=Nocardiaceae TaxID=85025 RepID=UPI00036B53D3|nr:MULTISPECIES: ABC transporter substrate-binding protein [Rhodococcus]OZC44049.1 ABC transporter substrate-binding protein [Rhodococcus sp. RS1C4]OZC62289.1 ABC transporter substrate-binding protein [Rhodococcus sp. 06-621-2]OZC79855.1 ABC transporter substrate-binding protein [Rhodococcus sp. 06-418-1B]OZE88102.1 ABC transporter substrate-binding protein [Rhodococcus sp. 15-649-1-2]